MAYALFGLLLVISPTLRGALRDVATTLDALFLPIAHLSLAWSVVIGLLGLGLWQKRRAAWAVAVAGLVLLNVGNLLFYIFSPQTFETPEDMGMLFEVGTVIQALLLVIMIALHPAFTTRTRRINVRAACLTWLIGTLVVCIMAVALVVKFPGSLVGSQRVGWALNHAALLSLVDRSFFDGHAPHAVAIVISIAAAFVLLLTLFVAVRSQQSQNSLSETDERVVRSMIKRFNQDDSLAYFATRRDKSIVYAPNGRAAVTYRVEVGCAIASADPLGEPDSWDAAIDAFTEHAREFGWIPAAMGASEVGARAYERHGLNAMHLGDEAILYTERFDLDNPEFKAVRQAIAHAERESLWMRVRRHHQIPREEMQQVEQRADSWRDTSDERGFSMALSRLGDDADGDCVLVEALKGEGNDATVVAQLSFVPWGSDGLSLDLMRRGPEAPNGAVEAMVAHLCSGEDILVRRISLNFAVFRKVFASETEVGVDPLTKSTRKVLVFLSRWWQMEALYRSNVKYNPEWVPRYMCFESPAALVRTSIASGIAEGFVPWIDSDDMRGHATVETPGAEAAVKAMTRWESRSGKKTKKVTKQVQARISAAQKLEEEGIDPWAVLPAPTMSCAQVLDAEEGQAATMSGRVVAKRKFGALTFIDVADASGTCQVIVDAKALPQEPVPGSVVPGVIEVSDYVHIEGTTGVSKKGQPSLMAQVLRMEAKALEPVASDNKDTKKGKQGGAQGASTAKTMAQALMTNSALRQQLVDSSARMVRVRDGLHAYGFLELPATPEIDSTLHLLAAVAGGADKIFTVDAARSDHRIPARQEVTHAEDLIRPQRVITVMSAHADAGWARRSAKGMLRSLETGEDYQVAETRSFHDAINDALVGAGQAGVSENCSAEAARAACQSLGLKARPDATVGSMLASIFEHKVLPTVTGSMEFYDAPADLQLGSALSTGESLTQGWIYVDEGEIIASGYALRTKPVAAMADDGAAARGAESDEEQEIMQLLQLGVPATACVSVKI